MTSLVKVFTDSYLLRRNLVVLEYDVLTRDTLTCDVLTRDVLTRDVLIHNYTFHTNYIATDTRILSNLLQDTIEESSTKLLFSNLHSIHTKRKCCPTTISNTIFLYHIHNWN